MRRKGLLFLLVVGWSLNLACSQNITLDYPEEARFNEEFYVQLELVGFDQGDYDVKIDFLKDEQRISEIWEGTKWQSSYNYLRQAISGQEGSEDFKLRIVENFEGDAEITVKIRSSEGKIKDFSGYSITVKEGVNNSDNSPDTENDSELVLELDWDDDDIVNGEEFEIEIIASDLDSREYDIKIWIEDEEGDIISDRYGDGEWKSGNYYVTEFLTGPGEDEGKIRLRIREEYKEFEGEAKIFLKLKNLDEIDEDIEVLEKEEITESSKTLKTSNSNSSDPYSEDYQQAIKDRVEEYMKINPDVIKLGNSKAKIDAEDIKTPGTVIYESKTERVKKYSVYGFALLCAILCILMYMDRLRWQRR